jgi:hypothetical protein
VDEVRRRAHAMADMHNQHSVTPNAPADLEKLRSTMRMHAEHMQGGRCGTMGGGM